MLFKSTRTITTRAATTTRLTLDLHHHYSNNNTFTMTTLSSTTNSQQQQQQQPPPPVSKEAVMASLAKTREILENLAVDLLQVSHGSGASHTETVVDTDLLSNTDTSDSAATTTTTSGGGSNVRILGHAVLQKPNYTGHTLLSQEGIQLAKIPEKRFYWYLKKGLATQVDEFTIQLNFAAKGKGNFGDPFYESEQKNACVCCGDETHYTRHHVVPYEYRRNFPVELKASNSHDIVLLCSHCHEVYETEAMKLKKDICEEYGVDINGFGKERDQAILQAKRSANALLQHRDKIPAQRIEQLTTTLTKFCVERGLMNANDNSNNYSESDALSDELMHKVLNMDEWIGLDQYVTHGQGVINKVLEGAMTDEERLKRLDMFAISWRQHFVDIMQPKFINPHWSVSRSMKKQ